VQGIILNNFHLGDFMEEDNRKMIEAITSIKSHHCRFSRIYNGDFLYV